VLSLWNQPEPHACFDKESALLRSLFGSMGGGCSAYVLGDAYNGLQWHVFVADDQRIVPDHGSATYSLEVCMTQLMPAKAAQFVRGQGFVSAARTSADSGISALLPGAEIDDYVFEPCGYSMNGVEGKQFSTIHITPEEGCVPISG
jgi:S-adenosylmethionine decarboxylase